MSTLLKLKEGFVEREPNGDIKITRVVRKCDTYAEGHVTVTKEDAAALADFLKAQS